MTAAFQVLVVDDEPALREICEEALSGDGHAVTLAGNGQDAIDKLGGSCFDLVISDLRMPDMNGQALIQGRMLESNDSLRAFVTKLCERSMQLGRSIHSR